jgi:sugar lactone lactonase YvrE
MWLWILLAVVVVLLVEVGSVLKNRPANKNFYVQIVQTATGHDQPCGIFSAWDLAVFSNNQLALSDQGNKRIVLFDHQGKFTQTITEKEAGGPKFGEISGMTSDPKGNFYVIDTWNGLIRAFNPDGRPFMNVKLNNKGFYGPRGVAWDNDNFIVADSGSHRIVKISASGDILATWGNHGKGDGQLDGPSAVAIDAIGNIYVADGGNDRVVCFDPNGKFLRNFDVGGSGVNVAVDPKGLLYVTVPEKGLVKAFTTDGKLLGTLVDVDQKGQIVQPFYGIKVNSDGNLVGCRADQIVVIHPLEDQKSAEKKVEDSQK